MGKETIMLDDIEFEVLAEIEWEDDRNNKVYYIIYSADALEQGYYESLSIVPTSEENMYCILADDEFVNILSTKVQKCFLLHEIGHMELGHSHSKDEEEKYLQDRIEYALSGKVAPVELEADEYMFEMADREDIEEFISYSKRLFEFETSMFEKIKNNLSPEDYRAIEASIKEFDLRRAHLEELLAASI